MHDHEHGDTRTGRSYHEPWFVSVQGEHGDDNYNDRCVCCCLGLLTLITGLVSSLIAYFKRDKIFN